jgi:DUF971 family protein
VEIRLKADRRTLHVAFDNGEAFDLSAEYLRIASPSAEVKGHGQGDRKTVPGKREVQIIRIEPVGNYAVRLVFDDMHDTGLFSWAYLHELGTRREEKWGGYLAELAEKGLSRDPIRP